MRNKSILALLVVVGFCGASLVAADPVIYRGIDVFSTTTNGKSYYSFAEHPIPAGFFCKGSPAFSGRVTLRGLPLETAIPGQLGGADTIVERLDDATFDAQGVAVTRVRLRALSLVSIDPIKTRCGAFHVYISLAGPQRVTTMRIQRTHVRGGSFSAPIAVDARVTFVPVKGRSSRKLELKGNLNFPGNAIPWSLEGRPTAKRIASILVDTDGDLVPDTRLPGTSNFAPGWLPQGVPAKSCTLCEPEICHDGYPDEAHCTGGVWACYPQQCP